MRKVPERVYLSSNESVNRFYYTASSEKKEKLGRIFDIEYIRADLTRLPYIERIDNLASDVLNTTTDANALRLANNIKQLFRSNPLYRRVDNDTG
jgi:predicted metallopeptidase